MPSQIEEEENRFYETDADDDYSTDHPEFVTSAGREYAILDWKDSPMATTWSDFPQPASDYFGDEYGDEEDEDADEEDVYEELAPKMQWDGQESYKDFR